MTKALPPSLRIHPANWLGPVDVDGSFALPPRRLEADVGCGKGRFLLARASAYPDISFLGIDRMLGRLRKIESASARLGLRNIRLLRCDAAYATAYLLPDRSLDTIYVFFPDPWPKERHHGHRLLSTEYIAALARVLKIGAHVHVATDHLPYFEEIRERMGADLRFEAAPTFVLQESERTDFELLYLKTKPIGRGSWRLRPEP